MPPASSTPPRWLTSGRAALVLGVAIMAAYANALRAPFVFDDIAAVTQNPSIQHFATAFAPGRELSVTGRPLVNLSLAANYALGGFAPWGYHAANLALHFANALLLFGLLRRTWPISPHSSATTGRGESTGATDHRGIWPAFAVALIWSSHPLQTATVTYVMQRSELLVSSCFLLTLYAFARATRPAHGPSRVSSPPINGPGRTGWLVGSVVACGFGMAAKEVMVSAPLVVLLYDRTFAAGSFSHALRSRRGYYAALAATWIILLALVFGTDNRGSSAGFGTGISWLGYAGTQFYALAHYLWLLFWPEPLVFDYGTALVTDPLTIALGALVVGAALIATLRALWRRTPAGFYGAWAFAVLAPSSSVVPIATQTMAEHRVYLAVLAPLALAIAGVRWLGPRMYPPLLATGAALVALTVARNEIYRSELALWQDTAAKVPGNARAHYNYGVALLANGDQPHALTELTLAVRLDPHQAASHQKLGDTLLTAGRPADALREFEASLRLAPETAAPHFGLGNTLVLLGRVRDALPHYAAAAEREPNHASLHYNYGRALADSGDYERALAEFETAARLDPSDASARNNAQRLREYLRPTLPH